MKIRFAPLLAALALAGTCLAVETRFWQQTDQTDFEKGSLDRLSLRSDGRIYLAPSFQEIFDSSTPYLWSIAIDTQGNVYTAGGGTGTGSAKLFVTGPNGKTRTLAELDGLEIHAIAVDRSGQVYAATDPDGKVYKIPPGAKPRLFYDPHAKYIWALGIDSKNNLFIATGDKGEIYRVTPAGQGSVFFKTEETHARSMVVDSSDNLIVGTEPGGLLIRISPAGNGFVLYQSPKREMTAVAVAPGGDIYAAGVGTRPTSAAAALPVPALPQSPVTVQASAAPASPAAILPARLAVPPSLALPSSPVTGGSDVYRINPDGSPRKVWTNAQDVVYAIGFDHEGRPLIGTGNRGRIYRLDSPVLNTLLVEAPPTQITGFVSGPQRRLYAITGNIGKIYEIGPGLATKGIFQSDVLDAGGFSYWGRVEFRGTPANAAVYTRTGNLNRPQDNWSSWAPLKLEPDSGLPACGRCLNGRIASPSARFLQYKIELSARTSQGAGKKASPEIASVEAAYLPKNFAPIIEEIDVGPPNYRFPAPPNQATATPPALILPPFGQKRRNGAVPSLDLGSAQSVSYAKGFMGARWNASDENSDSLIYTVEIRGVNETGWNLLKDKVREKYFSWDSTAFPDGEYEVRITASDSPGNPPGEALSAILVSDPFLIDNTPPQITNLASSPRAGGVEVRWQAHDARSIIDRAEYSVNGGDWILIEPTTKLSDAPEEEYLVTVPRVSPGEQTIAVRVTDSYENQAVAKTIVK
ncbi:MAG: hypothetical protein ACR2NN_22480 [Bryobacteraceae bacterium]